MNTITHPFYNESEIFIHHNFGIIKVNPLPELNDIHLQIEIRDENDTVRIQKEFLVNRDL
jgi:hypothetical protein